MSSLYNRRQMLKVAGPAVAGLMTAPTVFAADAASGDAPRGLVAGEPTAAAVGNQILRRGGNAVDALVAAGLAAAVAAPQQCGIGGYGGHMVIALAGGKKVTAIDFNSAAPAAAKSDMFAPDATGAIPGRINEFGWLASGVPGTLGGMQLALERYGTRPFPELVAPAIQLAREGFPVSPGLSNAIRSSLSRLQADADSAKLFLRAGSPLKAGEKLSNPNLATLLETLADRGSVDAFYRGDIGRRIAAEFGKHGGLVTAQDLASYQAREVEVLRFRWGGFTLCTAPLTAGGITVIEALSILKELNWKTLPEGVERDFARIEALRLAWDDRLRLLGDPDKSRVPFRRLLSQEYGHSLASRVQAALTERKPIPLLPDSRPHGGTVHLNAVDAQGNMAALTLTHGNYFGACVTIEEFGLTLGHGMSRFDPHPSHPNAPGPGKRPLHNMCPSIVLRDAMPILAIGATGGRKIPNALFDVLTHFMGLEESFEQSIVAPRLHTEGDVHLTMEQSWPAPKVELLKNLGYTIATGDSATVQAISFDPRTQKAQAAAR